MVRAAESNKIKWSTPVEFTTQKAVSYKLGHWVVTSSEIVRKRACSAPSSLLHSTSPFRTFPLYRRHWKCNTIKRGCFHKQMGGHACKLFFSFYGHNSQSVVPGPAASALPENLLEMHILRLCPRPAAFAPLGQSPQLEQAF